MSNIPPLSWSSGPDTLNPDAQNPDNPDMLIDEEIVLQSEPSSPTPQPTIPLRWQIMETDAATLASRCTSAGKLPLEILEAVLRDVQTLQVAIDPYLHDLESSNYQLAAQLVNRRHRLIQQLVALRDAVLIEAETRRREQREQREQQTPPVTSSHHLKLPKLKIKAFAGKAQEWVNFKTQYVSSIHSNQALDDTQRFQYLTSLLHGEPSHLIRHLPTTPSNYIEAWKIICQHYDDPRLLLQMHVESLLELPSLRSGKSTLRELYATAKQHLAGIRTLERENAEIQPAATAYIYLLLSKCTPAVRKEFRKEVRKTPAIGSSEAGFLEFLQTLVHVEEPESSGNSNKKPATVAAAVNGPQGQQRYCTYCRTRTTHFIAACSQFAQLSPDKQLQIVRRNNLCYTCLRKNCNRRCFRNKCDVCQRRHHTILHCSLAQPTNADNVSAQPVDQTSTTSSSKYSTYKCVLKALNLTSANSQSILATAILEVSNGQLVRRVRALLDSGSQRNFLCRRIASELHLTITQNNHYLQGIACISTSAVEESHLSIHSTCTKFRAEGVAVLLLDTIINCLPTNYFDIQHWALPRNIPLADPNFNVPGDIEMLIGSDIFWNILQHKKLKVPKQTIQLRQTSLGWIVVGKLNINESVEDVSTIALTTNLESTLEKFWHTEEPPSSKPKWTKEQEECEHIFIQTTIKNPTGPFTVYLPFKMDPKGLGESLNIAINQFLYLERKLHKDPKLFERYKKCIKEYEILGHCRIIRQEEWLDKDAYYIPHHAILKETSTSTKLRVVFNASMKTSTGLSLNECMMVGPVVQKQLVSILIRFRMKKFAFSADITKMYRQIRVHESHTRYQRILWRDSPNQQLICYELQTVTFGTASAPFLPTRCVRQVGLDIRESDLLSSSAILHDFYVDDILSGANTIEEARHIQVHVTESLKNAGFPLTKWCVNHCKLLEGIPNSDIEREFPLSEDGEVTIKTLGILWRPEEDTFQFYINKQFTIAKTKREILSAIASVYDPLGLAGPVIVLLKIFMQSICKITATTKESWNAPLPENLLKEWHDVASQLYTLKKIKIPRYYFDELPEGVELHGFSDASEKAFGAAIYIRGVHSGRAPCVHLVMSKSRVAPLKVQSIPRLELCGAALLAELISKVKGMLEVQYSIKLVRLWCDSTIALTWIHSASYRYETYIANRIQKVQDLSANSIWDYVGSEMNAADVLSRGLMPTQLHDCNIWWKGPQWLHSNWNPWSLDISFTPLIDCKLGLKRTELYSLVQVTVVKLDLFTKYSELNKLIRIIAFIMRFTYRVFSRIRYTGPLSLIELKSAKTLLIKLAQRETFDFEIWAIQQKALCNNGSEEKIHDSKISHLNPFLDEHGVLRVGGRLEHAAISWDQKYPILLHPQHPLTLLIIKSEHITHLHAGPRLLKSVLRRNYWVLRQHDAVQNCIRKCLKCIRLKAILHTQQMASLPKSRVLPSRPFQITGVDYSGPITVKCHNGKHKAQFKAYIALFICYSTKAVHLEVVANLSSLAFLNALNRFISRRGKPSEIHSDNGTTFVGAKSLLDAQIRKFLREYRNKIVDYAHKEGIEWHFIPAYTPHWGGLWESNIKCMKVHLKNALTAYSCFNFEELLTLLSKIEAILNSRPLTPQSSNPNDVNALTPGHFLIGATLTALPNESISIKEDCHTRRWRLIQQITKQFWKRWSSDYLNTLHQRNKWKVKREDLKVGDFVIIKDITLPQICWCMGRIFEVHQGKDGKVRLVTVRTKDGMLQCSIVNLVYLPIY